MNPVTMTALFGAVLAGSLGMLLHEFEKTAPTLQATSAKSEIKAVESKLARLQGNVTKLRAGLGALLNRVLYTDAVGLPSIRLVKMVPALFHVIESAKRRLMGQYSK